MNPYEAPKSIHPLKPTHVRLVLEFLLCFGPSLLEFSLWLLLIAAVHAWPVCDWCLSSRLFLGADCPYCLQCEVVAGLVILGAFQSIGRVVAEYRYYR